MEVREVIDRLLDRLPEEQLNQVYWEVNRIFIEYNFEEKLRLKQIELDYPYEIGEHRAVIEKWKQVFTPILEDEKERINYEQFLWHSFSYELLPALTKDEARQAFNDVEKSEVYFFYQHNVNKEHPLIEVFRNAKQLTADDIEHMQDVYVFDASFTWTYIKTHEDYCGPYFIQLEK